MPGPYGVTMEEPQNVSSPYIYVPNNDNNRGSVGAVVAWSFWKHFISTVLPQALNDLTNIPYD